MSVITTSIVANKADAYAKNIATLTSGMAGAEIQFEFSDEWTGLSKTAVFKAGSTTKYVILTSTNKCAIPYECLTTARVNLIVGVYGSDGDSIIIPTIYCSLGLINEGTAVTGSEPGEITQSLYNQVVALIADCDDELDTLKETAVKAVDVDATGANQVGTVGVSLTTTWVDASDHSKGKKATFVFTNLKGIQGEKGNTGDTGATGPQGETGATGNGISTIVLNTDYTLTITYTNGTSITTTSIRGAQGEKGETGDDGYSPSLSSAAISGGTRVTMTDATHTETFDVLNGTGAGDMLASTYDPAGGAKQVAFADDLDSLEAQDIFFDNNIKGKLQATDVQSAIDLLTDSVDDLDTDKYEKPSTGIPKTDLASDVQTSLGLADTALQSHQDISGKADKTTTVNGHALSANVTVDSTEVPYGSSTVSAALSSQNEQIVAIGGRVTTLESTWVNIPKSAAGHNAIYRGMNLLSKYTEAQLSAMIQAGTFDDIYIGDYITKTVTVNGTTYSNMVFRVAGLDTFWRHYGMTTHHVVLVPEGTFGSAQMNTSNTTSGGYQGSAMYTLMTTIGNNLNSSFNGGLSLVATTELFSSAINSTATNKNALTGMASSWGWASSRYADIMCEIEVYGSQVWGNGYDTGTGWYQLPIMQLDPTFRCISSSYWLRDIASSAFFAYASAYGYASYSDASSSLGVRPRFLIH